MASFDSRTVLLIALVAAILGGVATLAIRAATQPAEIEIRVVAQRLEGGFIEFGVQQRQGDGKWGERQLPRRNRMRAEGVENRWLHSTPLSLQLEPEDVESPVADEPQPDEQGEAADQQTERVLTELIPWYANPPNLPHSLARIPIGEIWQRDAQLGRALAQAPWIIDGISGWWEDDAIYGLGFLADRDPALARRILAYSSEQPLRDRNVFLLTALGELTWSNEEALERLLSQTWFVDGLDDEERAFITLLRSMQSSPMYEHLLTSRATLSRSIDLPLAGATDLWAFHHDAFPPEADMLAVIEQSVRGAEQLFGSPFPLTDVILLSIHAEESLGGANYGDSVVVTSPSDGHLDVGLIQHEVAHYYLEFDFGPQWLVEGGANFFTVYMRERVGSTRADSLLSVYESARVWCREQGVANIHALSDPEFRETVNRRTCDYSLGQYFLTRLYNGIGEAAFSSSLRDLHQRFLEHRSPATEEQIYETFLRHAPSGRAATLIEIYRTLHGGPFLGRN